jgi:hypothetical protein
MVWNRVYPRAVAETVINTAPTPVSYIDDITRGAQFLSNNIIRPGATAAKNAASRAWEAANTPTARTIGFTAAGAGALAAGGITAGRAIGDAATQTADEKAQNMFDNYVRDLENLNQRYQSQAQIEGIGDPTRAMNRQFESDVRQAEVIQDLDVLGQKKLDDLKYQTEIRNQPLYALARGRDRMAGMSDRMNQYAIALANTSQLYR